MRARAKTINFATIYGQGAHSLSRQLKVDHAEAKAFIDMYFERFAGVRSFLDSTVAQAKQRGYVETIFKRRRYIPELRIATSTFARSASAPRKTPDPGVSRRSHQGCDDSHSRVARESRGSLPPCCCRCTMSWCSRRPRGDRDIARAGRPRHDDGHHARRSARRRHRRRRQLARQQVLEPGQLQLARILAKRGRICEATPSVLQANPLFLIRLGQSQRRGPSVALFPGCPSC